ncbi:MAG: hypothetical protein SGJ24_19695 [Chloroflexota bacterium]|nr:hypothetical protein [Chloroflexota bacterium]
MADDLNGALRALANKWARRAQESARDSKAGGDNLENIAYQRGLAEGYYKAATELAEVIRTQPAVSAPKPPANAPSGLQDVKNNPNAGGRWGLPTGNPTPSSPSALTPSTSPAVPPASTVPSSSGTAASPAVRPAAPDSYMTMDFNEVLTMLQYSGTTPRDVQPRPDNSFLAIFSRWEDLTPSQRLTKIQKADFRLTVIESGLTKDTKDPYIIFAFKAQ